MIEIAWGRRVGSAFASRVVDIAKWLDTDPNYLMGAMGFETGRSFDPAVRNPRSTATGLIQFMEATARGLGTTTEKLAAMDAITQLDYVKRYFAPYRGRLKTLADVYMAVLLPKAIGLPESAALFRDDKGKVRDAYDVNSGLDTNRDGIITKAEATAKVYAVMLEGMKPENRG